MVLKIKSVNSVKKEKKLGKRTEKVVNLKNVRQHGSARNRTITTIKNKFSTKYELYILLKYWREKIMQKILKVK